ncbi:S ribonuclease [Pyrus ussuriensis x Pyrus communis]|uniref:S ribonuclease n=1 Tax=Pyrus ussuriensis x Pyrus communis TaxID=2448454 RepID=A0A5N5H6V2_9ROSA|nr:S ribonuclease [Pyrus ussuriensis x Pyrus communis]
MGRNGMGRDRMKRNGAGAKMPSDGNKEEEEGDGEVIILCSTDVERVVPGGVRWNENSPKTRPVEQLVPPVLGAPNVGRNALSHSVPSRPTYQTVPVLQISFFT